MILQIVQIQWRLSRCSADFQDITFTKSPVKVTSSKTVLIRNVGRTATHFTLSTEDPFKVTPNHGSLDVNERMQVEIFFNPQVQKLYTKLIF
jgi:hypothetical protein